MANKKLGYEIQVTADTNSLKTNLTQALLEISRTSNLDIDSSLKMSPAQINEWLKKITDAGEEVKKRLQSELEDTDISLLHKGLKKNLDKYVKENLEAFQTIEKFAGKSAKDIADAISQQSTKQVEELFDKLGKGTAKGKKSFGDMKKEIVDTKTLISDTEREVTNLNNEFNATVRVLTQVSNAQKAFTVETGRMSDSMTKGTRVAHAQAVEFNDSLKTMLKTVNELQRQSKKGFINTSATTTEIDALEKRMANMRDFMAKNVGSMTTQQVQHMNRSLEKGDQQITAMRGKVTGIEDRNATHSSQSAIRAHQTKTWDKINAIDQRFSDAKQQMTAGQASKVNLRSLSGSLGNLTKYKNELTALQLEAHNNGDTQKAQAIQELITASESKIRAHRQTYGAISNRFGSYDDAIRGQLGTVQATKAASILNSRKGALTHANMMLGQGQLVGDAEMAELLGYGAQLDASKTSLKRKLKSKTASQEELEEVKRHLKLVEEAREAHRIDMEKIAHKQATNEERIQKSKDAEILKQQKEANAKKYADMVAHLTANQHLIEAMSSQELKETRAMLRGARVAMSGDADSAVAIGSLQDTISSRLKETDKPTLMDHLKKKFGFGSPNGPFNNKNLNAFHGLNHKITNVSQMLGTSLYGMGAAGLGSAIVGGTIEKAAELETAKLTIAGMVNTYSQFVDAQGRSVSNAQNLNKSIEYSSVLYGKLRDAAKSSLMTTGEITEGFLTGAPRLREKGFSDEQAIEITKKIMMLGRATGLTSTAIMSDIRDFAAGNVNTRSQVLMTAGINKDRLQDAFKTGGSDAAFKYFQERMSSFDATFKKIADTPAGQLNAFKIEVEQLSQTMGEKLAPILIPQLQKFRQLISDWVASGDAERFITSFGKFVEAIADAGVKFMEFMRPWVSDFDSLMTVTLVGIFATMAAKMSLQAVAMSNPATAIVALVGTLVGGLLAQQKRLEDSADSKMLQILDNENTFDTAEAKTKTRRIFVDALKSGNVTNLSNTEKFYLDNKEDITLAEPFIRAFLGRQSNIRKNSPVLSALMTSMYDTATDIANGGSGGNFGFELNSQGVPVGEERKKIARAVLKFRNDPNMPDSERFDRIMRGQEFSKGGLTDLKNKAESLRSQALKELDLDKAMRLYPEDDIKIRAKIAEIMDRNEFKNTNKNQPGEDLEKDQKVKSTPQGPKLTTLEDVLKTYARGRNELLQQRIGATSDTAMSGNEFLKPILLGRGLSAGVTQAVATWQESVVANRDKGPYALAEANAQLTNTLEQLRNSFLENIRTVQANIATQKEQNRALRENITLQEKANQLENAKFELSQMKPFDMASGAAYVSKAIGVANMQRNLSIAQANASVSSTASEQAIANIKYLDQAGLLDTLSPEQQSIYRRAMSGDTSAIGQLPPGILNTNLKQFSVGASAAGAVALANRAGGGAEVGSAAQWKASLKGMAKSMGLSVSSEYRPGARTHAKGTKSWHSKSEGNVHGLAIDFAGTKQQMGAFFDAVRSTYGDGAIQELIYTPKGAVFNGKYTRTFNPITMKDHYDHVHVSLKGGKKVDVEKVQKQMPSQDRGEGTMSSFTSGLDPATGLPIGPYETEGMPPMLSEWFAMNGQLTGLKATGAIDSANNTMSSLYQDAFNTGSNPGMALMQFEAQQRLGLIGLQGTSLNDRLRLNKADLNVFNAQNKANQYLTSRQQGLQGALAEAFPGLNDGLGWMYSKKATDNFIEKYLADSVSGYGDRLNPANEDRARLGASIERNTEYRNNLQQITEKVAANLERLADIDFSQLVQFVQNPYARIGSVVNPSQALVQNTQQSMETAINNSEVAIMREEARDKANGTYAIRLAFDPDYYNRKRRNARNSARATASSTLASQAQRVAMSGALNGVGSNFLSTNFYGALTGNQNFDIAGIISPLTGLGNDKFSQSTDILMGLATGTLDLNEISENPALADILAEGGKAGLKRYAMGNMLGKIGGNLAGNYLGNQIFAGKDPASISAGTDIGGALAAAGTFGSKFMGPAGIIAGSVFGGLIGGLFGGKKANPDEERFRERQRQHFDKMEKMAEETNKLLRPSYDVYNTIRGDVLYGSASRFYSNRAYSPLGNQLTTGAN